MKSPYHISFNLFLVIILLQISISDFAYSQNNLGTEFYLTFLPAYVKENESHNKNLILYITSKVETKVRVEIKSKGYYEEKMTIPNDLITFEFSPHQAQPYVQFPDDLPKIDNIYEKAAIHITSDEPISINSLTRYPFTSDGYLAMPIEMLGNEYIIASYSNSGAISTVYSRWSSQTAIIAIEDNTIVDFELGGNELTRTTSGLNPGESMSNVLNKGDIWLISAQGSVGDLSGSKVKSDKSIGVISGHYCAFIPVVTQACDCLTEMELSLNNWSNEIIVPNIYKRKKGSILKIFASENNTKVYRNGELFGTIKTSGGMEGTGFLHVRANLGESKPVIISADNPISVTLFNPGQDDDKILTDPFQMILAPVDLFQFDILFSTPGVRDFVGMDENFIALIFSSFNGLIPDHFQFASIINDVFTWEQLNIKYGNTNILYAGDINGKSYYVKTIYIQEEGVYGIKADEAFMSYSYGFSSYDSYGFPSSMITLFPRKSIIIGSLTTGFQSITCEEYIDNNLLIENPGNDALIISKIELKGINHDSFYILENLPIIIGPGKSKNIKIRFQPDSPGQKYAEIELISNAIDNPNLIIPISATKLNNDFITTDISVINFENLSYNEDSNKSFILKNLSSSECTYILSSSNLIEISPGKVTLQANEETLINVYFAGSSSEIIIQEQISITDTICNKSKYLQVEGKVIGEFLLELSVLNLFGEPGDIITAPIILSNQINLEESGVKSINIDLNYNSTLLFPLNRIQQYIDDNIAKITIYNIPIKYKIGDTLTTVKFKVGLGNAERCDLELSNARAIGAEVAISYINGIFTLLGVCYEGESARLLNPNSQAGLINITPNPAIEKLQIDFSLYEKGYTEIVLLNYLGETVKTVFSENVNKYGLRSEVVDLKDLSSGQYILIFKSPTIIESKNIRIIK